MSKNYFIFLCLKPITGLKIFCTLAAPPVTGFLSSGGESEATPIRPQPGSRKGRDRLWRTLPPPRGPRNAGKTRRSPSDPSDLLFPQAYHSQLLESKQNVGNIALLPIRTQFRGPAPPALGAAADLDIVDEAIYYFKANVFFRNYEVKVKIYTDNPDN